MSNSFSGLSSLKYFSIISVMVMMLIPYLESQYSSSDFISIHVLCKLCPWLFIALKLILNILFRNICYTVFTNKMFYKELFFYLSHSEHNFTKWCSPWKAGHQLPQQLKEL